jgi:uncharacterized protein YjiS (DUF1127 family)
MARTLAATAQTPFVSQPARQDVTILARLGRMIRLARQRQQLASLDTERLVDLGLTAQQARSEASRPFWDAPRAWRG